MNSATILRSATILTLGGVIEALAGFGAQLILARALSPEIYGRFATSFAVIGILFSVGTLRIAFLITRSPQDDLRKDQTMLLSALVWETLACGIIGALWVVLDRRASSWDMLLVLSAALQHWTGGNRAICERTLAFHRIGIAETLAALTGHAVSLAIVMLGGGAAALYVREAVNAGMRLYGMVWAKALTASPVVWLELHQWRAIFTRSKGIWLDGLLEGAFQRLSVVAASGLAGFHGAGLFFFAQRLAGVPQQLMGPIVSRLSAPWFSSMQGAKRLHLLKRLLTLSAIPLVLAAICAYELAGWVVPRVFGGQWQDSVTVLQAMAGAIVFITLAEIVKTFLIVNHNARGILLGRLAQYSGFAAVIVIYQFREGTTTPTALGLALSLATVLAFLAMLRKAF